MLKLPGIGTDGPEPPDTSPPLIVPSTSAPSVIILRARRRRRTESITPSPTNTRNAITTTTVNICINSNQHRVLQPQSTRATLLVATPALILSDPRTHVPSDSGRETPVTAAGLS
jgi:hypothetical protein